MVEDHRPVRLERPVDQLRRCAEVRARRPAPARIASASTSRCSSRSRAHAAAEPVSRSRSRQRAPLGLPGAGGALVLLLHRGEHRRHQPRHAAACRRAPTPRRPGCACAPSPRSRRGPRRPRAPRRQQRHVARDLRQHAGEHARAPAASAAGRRRFVCHGSTGSASPSCARHARRRRAGIAVADRPAHLHRERRVAPARRTASSIAVIQPAALSPNDVGSACCSSVRPMIGVSRCASASAGGGVGRRARVGEQRLERALGDEHHRRVEDVLATSPRRAVSGKRLASGTTGDACSAASRPSAATCRSSLRVAAARRRAPPRRRASPAATAASLDRLGDRAARVEPAEQLRRRRRRSRRCPGCGCRIGSHRRSRWASSVSRRSAGTLASTGSSAVRLEVDARRQVRAAGRARRRGPRSTARAARPRASAPSSSVGQRANAGGSWLPGLHQRVRDRVAGAVEHAGPRSRTPPASATGPSSHGSPIARNGPTVCDGVVLGRHQ